MPDQYRQGVEREGYFPDISVLEEFLKIAVLWEVITLSKQVLGYEDWCRKHFSADCPGKVSVRRFLYIGVGVSKAHERSSEQYESVWKGWHAQASGIVGPDCARVHGHGLHENQGLSPGIHTISDLQHIVYVCWQSLPCQTQWLELSPIRK